MSIQEQLKAELRDATRRADAARLEVIRAVETEVTMTRTAKGFTGAVDDALYEKVIGAYVKRMRKAQAEYADLGERGAEMAEKLKFEVEYLSRWLPQMLSEDETRELVEQAIAELGLSDANQAGRVVGHLMKSHKGTLDGGLASRLAREALS